MQIILRLDKQKKKRETCFIVLEAEEIKKKNIENRIKKIEEYD